MWCQPWGQMEAEVGDTDTPLTFPNKRAHRPNVVTFLAIDSYIRLILRPKDTSHRIVDQITLLSSYEQSGTLKMSDPYKYALSSYASPSWSTYWYDKMGYYPPVTYSK